VTATSGIRAVAIDVDGVLTDGTFWWGPDGQEWKRFSFRDVMGVSRALRSGLIIAMISGEESPLVDRFAGKMGIEDVFKGCKDKARALREFAQRRGLDLSQIAFMGDDVNDLEAMQLAGLAAAPANAEDSVRAHAQFVSQRDGGHGAVRELIEHLIERSAGQRGSKS
jgi:3-deoxy-D-manno-octulosonate 8-phosphate phosphatase (KDO 8-P phosphatase)